MNKFSDGFSDNSYDDLLNEYAGNALGSNKTPKVEPQKRISKPVTPPKKVEPQKRVSKPIESPKNNDFKIDIQKKNTINEKSNDFGLIKSFEEENAERELKGSNTMEFSKQSRVSKPVIEKRNDGKKPSFNDKLNSIKNSAQKKIYSDNTSPKEQQSKKKKGKFSFNALIVNLINAIQNNKKAFIVMGCCVLVAIIASSAILSCVNDVLAINRSDEKIVEVTLPNDADTFTAIRVLDKAGLIKNTVFCNFFINMMKLTNKNYLPDDGYLPGIYYFTEDMGVEKMLARFQTSVKRGKIVSVTIPEGYTIDQIFNRLEKNDICPASSLYKVVDEIDFSDEYDFIAKIPDKEQRYHALEGYFFPATYEFEQGATPGDVIREFLNTFQKRWTEEYTKKAEALGKTTDEIIKIASIIEKEGANKDQFKLVSSVLHNRLNRSGLYPTLDCDSTKDYVTNTIAERITSPSQINAFILNYSTYERAGLPASAICNPGEAAIEAALNPDTTQYYFFAHDKNKKIYMATTLEEHNANKRTLEKVNAQND